MILVDCVTYTIFGLSCIALLHFAFCWIASFSVKSERMSSCAECTFFTQKCTQVFWFWYPLASVIPRRRKLGLICPFCFDSARTDAANATKDISRRYMNQVAISLVAALAAILLALTKHILKTGE